MKKLWALLGVALLLLLLCACVPRTEEEDAAEDAAGTEVIDEEETQASAEEQPQLPDQLPQELIGRWQLENDASAGLEIGADGTVSFFMGSGRDGEGRIEMEEGRAVAHTVSYLEGVEESFVLTPEPSGVKMDYRGESYFWVPEQPKPADAGSTARVDEGFDVCLDNIGERVHPGTSSAFMSAVEQAAALMDWAESTVMAPSDVFSAFNARFDRLDNAGKATLLTQLELVDGAYQQLLTPGQEDLLASAGVKYSGYPWDGPLDAVEALMTVAGLR